MKEIIKKMALAKQEVKNTPVKKEGRNDFSKYDYFTPAQIEKIVSTVCETVGILPKFDLIRNDLGVTGKLTIFDIESGESLVYEMASAIPSITATNIAQQLGGCVTYTERYLKMTAFGITDNRLDFDTDENTKKQVKEDKETRTPAQKKLDAAIAEMNAAKDKDQFIAAWTNNKEFQINKDFVMVKDRMKTLLKIQ